MLSCASALLRRSTSAASHKTTNGQHEGDEPRTQTGQPRSTARVARVYDCPTGRSSPGGSRWLRQGVSSPSTGLASRCASRSTRSRARARRHRRQDDPGERVRLRPARLARRAGPREAWAGRSRQHGPRERAHPRARRGCDDRLGRPAAPRGRPGRLPLLLRLRALPRLPGRNVASCPTRTRTRSTPARSGRTSRAPGATTSTSARTTSVFKVPDELSDGMVAGINCAFPR